MSRSSYAASTSSRTSVPPADEDIPGGYPSDVSPVVSSEQSLSEAVHARRAEFTRPQTIRIKIGTWNVAGKKGTEQDIADWFVGGKGVSEALSGLGITDQHHGDAAPSNEIPSTAAQESFGEQEERFTRKQPTLPLNDKAQVPAGDDVGLYVLGLQEIVDITSATEALRPYTDSTNALKWKAKLEEAMPSGYHLIAEQQLIGLMLFIYASPTVRSHVGSVSTTSCGTGLMGYMGNKGAVTTRIVLGETTRLVFVNSHLSSGTGKAELERRNWDAQQILSRTRFDPIVDSMGSTASRGERIGEEDFAFWFGDLNYRLEGIPGNDVRRLLMLHTRNEYDESQKSAKKIDSELVDDTEEIKQREAKHQREASAASTVTSSTARHSDAASIDDEAFEAGSDPANLQTTLDSLLSHDELRQQQNARKMFHDGWREGPLTFLPTYKYDVGSVGMFDSGDKKRGPSWCDRILYRTRKDKLDFENSLIDEEEAKKKDADMAAKGIDKAVEDEAMLYDYDPEVDGDDETQAEPSNQTGGKGTKVLTKEGYDDIITLEYYVSHQRVLSSDHKPLDAIFKLEYDAAVPELKAKVHHEVARALDKAENEGRPVITLVIDGVPDEANTESDGVDFRGVRYDEDKVRSLTIANTGRAVVEFGLVSQPFGSSQSMETTPRWLTADIDSPMFPTDDSKGKKGRPEWSKDIPYLYRLDPGDACSIRLTAGVHTKEYAKSLNESDQLEAVLILRVKDGRDHFIPVRGTWKQSIHGRTIDALCRIPEGGVRMLQSQRPGRSDRKEASADDDLVMWSAPREVLRLTDGVENLVERVLAEANILQLDTSDDEPASAWLKWSGWPFVSESWQSAADQRRSLRVEINEALETNAKFDAVLPAGINERLDQLEAMSDCLISFLDGLEDGVITADIWKQLQSQFFSKRAASTPRDEQRAAVLEVLASSSRHSTSFIIITSMLGRIVQELANYRQILSARQRFTDDVPGSPLQISRRSTLDNTSDIARDESTRKALAVAFADALVRSPEGTSSKMEAAIQEQKQELVNLFLDPG